MSEQHPSPEGMGGEEAEFAEHAEHAEHAEFAEFAERAEFAEFAEFAEHAEHTAHAEAEAPTGETVAAPEQGHAHHAHGLHLHGHAEADVLWRKEMLHLIDQAATRLQAVGRSRLHRQDKPEPRWPVSAAVIVAIVLQVVLPHNLILRSDLHFILPTLEGALLLGLFAANPLRIEKRSKPIRTASIALIVLMTTANAASAVLLVRAIITDQLGPRDAAIRLLLAGAAIWGTNVIAFALWYWEFDRGGPVSRLEGTSPYPDLLFTQMTSPELTPSGWGPHFVDYLYLSFTNATAFSPTDTLPLARWAKLTMLVQSAVSLVLGALVIARAVGILP